MGAGMQAPVILFQRKVPVRLVKAPGNKVLLGAENQRRWLLRAEVERNFGLSFPCKITNATVHAQRYVHPALRN